MVKTARKRVLISIHILALTVLVILGIGVYLKSQEIDPANAIQSEYTLLPYPSEIVKGEGNFVMTKNTEIYVAGRTEEETEELKNVAQLFGRKIRVSTGYKFEVTATKEERSNCIVLTTIDGSENQGEEGYQLHVSKERVTIKANSPEGVFRGTQTLRQLLPSEVECGEVVSGVDWTIPVVTINDQPEYEYRGMMIDVARHFCNKEDLKRQIDLAAQFKINKLHLHLTDDQGWRLEIKKWPLLTEIGGSSAVDGEKGGFYTQADFKEIVAYAAERYIEVIPEVEMPSHSNAALSSYEFLNPDGKRPDLYTGIEVGFSSFQTRDEETYQFIEDVIREIAEISPSQYIHIGGDEAHCVSDEEYNYFVGRAAEIVKKYGKTPIGWDPIELSPDIDNTTVLQHWSNNSINVAKKKNMKTIISISSLTYLDMKYDESCPYGLTWAGLINMKTAYDWNLSSYGDKEQIIGIEAPLWAETITNQEKMDYMVYPRLIGYAEIGWSKEENRSWNDYKTRIDHFVIRLKNQGVNYCEDALKIK